MLWISKQKFFNRYLPMFLSVVVLAAAMSVYFVVRNQNKTADAAWYSSSWGYRKAITIDHNKVSGTASSTINSFPVLINVTDSDLKTVTNGGKVGKDTGIDILFTSADGTTKLSHELEKYASTTGATIAWVKIPILSALTDTTIFIYFGNSGASDQQDTTNVWETNFKGVWHLKDGTTLTLTDSTSNGGNGTAGNSPTATTGQIDGAANFSAASSQYVYVSDSDRYSFGNGTTDSPFTWSTWVYMPNVGTVAGNFIEKYVGFPGGEYALAPSNTNVLYSFLIDTSSGGYIGRTVSNLSNYIPNNTWALVTWTYSGGATNASNKIYINGVQRDDGNFSSGAYTAMENSIYDVNFAKQQGLTGGYLDGKMDEVRLYAGERNVDYIKTEYNNQTSPSTFYSYGALSIQSSSPSSNTSGAGAGWYNASWSYRKPITIDKNKVSGVATSTHSNFPMLFSVTDTDLKYTSYSGKVGKTDGTDILFTSSDGTTKLSHEIEKYSSSTGETIIWVKIPLLSATSDTTIYIYFGNSGASDQQDITNVWDSNYKGVWHLSESTGTYFDSTANNNDSTNETLSARGQAGKIGLAPRFSSSTPDKIVLPSIQLTNAVTLNAWFYPTETTQYARILARAYTSNAVPYINYSLVFDTSNPPKIIFGLGIGGATYDLLTNRSFLFNRWHNITATYDGSNTKVYVDGVLDNSASRTGNIDTITQVVEIGHNTVYSPSNDRNSFTGYIDEARISDTARNADWIKTEYNNQTSPATFYAYGALGTERSSGNGVKDRGVSGVSWYSNNWSYRKPITIDKNKVSGVATSTHSNFPMLFSVTDTDLKYTSYSGKVGKTDGTDILFTSSDGITKLSHEIEKYSSSTGETIIWVKIPLLSATSDTTIYIYFGNSGASDQQDATNVWDSNYRLVYHLKDGDSTSANFYQDSTSNNIDATLWDGNSNSTQDTGKMGYGYNFAGDADYMALSDATDPTAYTVSAWVKYSTTSPINIFTRTDSSGPSITWSHQISIDATSKPVSYVYDQGSASSKCVQGNTLTQNQWYHITGSGSNSGSLKLYVNGNQIGTPLSINTLWTGGDRYRIAQNTGVLESSPGVGCPSATAPGYFGGVIDEIHFSLTIRSDDWIKTEYNNQSSPSTFYSYGALGTSSRQDNSGGSTPTVKVRGGVKFR